MGSPEIRVQAVVYREVCRAGDDQLLPRIPGNAATGSGGHEFQRGAAHQFAEAGHHLAAYRWWLPA